MATLLYPPTDNDLQKQLNANYTVGATTITFNNTTSVQNLPGSIVINRIDTNGGLLPSSGRTYYTYTGTSGATLTGVALADGTDQDHAIGQVVEFVPDISWAQAINDVITTEHNADGTHKETALDSMITGTEASGDIIYHNGTIWTRLPKGTDGQALVLASGLPSWGQAGSATWTAFTGAYASGTTITISGLDTTTYMVKGTLLKWQKSDDTFKTGMVISSSFSTNTTLTIIGSTVEAGDKTFYYGPKANKETFIIAGTFPSAATTNLSKTFIPEAPIYVLGADLVVDTAGSGTGSTVVDINDDGTTMFTTKPTLTTTGTTDLNNVSDAPATAVAASSLITVDVDSVTATTAPSNGYVALYYYPVDMRYR